MSPLTTEQAAYIAGIIDGEGSISLALGGGRSGRYSHLLVRVANTDPLLIAFLGSVAPGGRTYTATLGSGFKEVTHLCWSGRVGVGLLRQVVPYLVIKKDRARLVLHLHEANCLARRVHGQFNRGNKIPDWLAGLRVETHAKLLEANRRGARAVE